MLLPVTWIEITYWGGGDFPLALDIWCLDHLLIDYHSNDVTSQLSKE